MKYEDLEKALEFLEPDLDLEVSQIMFDKKDWAIKMLRRFVEFKKSQDELMFDVYQNICIIKSNISRLEKISSGLVSNSRLTKPKKESEDLPDLNQAND